MKATIQYNRWNINDPKKDYRISSIYFLDNDMVAITYQTGNMVRTIELSVRTLEEMNVLNFDNLLPYIHGKQ